MKMVAWRVERGVEASSDLGLTLGRYSLKFPSLPAPLPSWGPTQGSQQSVMWGFKLHRPGCPTPLKILPDSVPWRRVYKEQLKHLDLNSGKPKLPPLSSIV